jgi:hypothetical protein
VNPLKNLSILQTTARYLSNVSSLAMHSFSIWLAITLESIFRIHRWTPIARLWRPSNTALYSTMLLLHVFASALNYTLAAYFNLIPKGKFNIAVAPAPETPQALSQYTCHGVSTTIPSV